MTKPSDPEKFLRKQTNWNNLAFYRKADVLYLLTKLFTGKFMLRGDRTIDQMVQAARSGKQNIVEGMADGVTSSEMEIKLINVARGSIQELREDYVDYLATRGLILWDRSNPRQQQLLEFCRTHNNVDDYTPLFKKANDEELCNLAITLCHQVDKMICTWLNTLEETFREEGGIKERMTAVRMGRRQTQNEIIAAQAHEIETLKKEIAQLRTTIENLRCKR